MAFVIAVGLMTSCKNTMNENPLLTESKNPYGAIPFDRIQKSDYKPAFEAAIAEAKAEMKAIIENPEAPTFENTVEAMERSGKTLNRVSSIFFNLVEADTDSVMQAIAEEVSPMLTEYSMSIMLNDSLFNRVKAVWECRDSLNLNQEQARLLSETYKAFERNGANLSPEQKSRFAKVEEELSLATLRFGKNALAANNEFEMNITDSTELAGLPGFVVEMAAEEAKSRNEEGWTFTLKAPSCRPFLKYSENRELREKIWLASATEAVGGENSNLQTLLDIVRLRTEEAQILGYETYSDYALETRMAKTKENVATFLNDLMSKTFPYAKKELEEIQKYANANGFEGRLMNWDYSYWSEKYKNEKFSMNEEMLKPYFRLENVQAAIFDLANRLYGLNFEEDKSIPVYQKDVKAFNVTDADGRFMALLYIDYFPRESKRSGAWMTDFRGASIENGEEERPFVSLVTNFTKPTENMPSLLTFDEVTTILHEFGHALHGMLAEGTYASLTGTNVARDFVELPSQIMENWAYEPEYLKTFAKHYQTGEVIPQELVDKIVAAKNYMAGYNQVGQLKYGLIDMAWYSSDKVPTDDPVAYEQSVIKDYALFPQLPDVATSPSFGHIFSGGYAAGYYSYKWAEVLEADAFALFKETGIFNKETAESFRKNILSRGKIEDADVLYRNFRGRDPEPDALMKKLGLN